MSAETLEQLQAKAGQQREAIKDAAALLDEIMRDDCNAQDEAEKWLRAYAPEYLQPQPTPS